MKHLIPSILALGALVTGLQASADDMQKDPASKQAMKTCMTQMQAKNESWTHEQIKSACKTQMKNNANGSQMMPTDSTAPTQTPRGSDSNPTP